MTDNLKERLDALKKASEEAEFSEAWAMRISEEDLTYYELLDEKFSSGDLVTKEELEAAVAAEREACAAICDGVNNHDNPMTARDVADTIRARTEPCDACEGFGSVATDKVDPITGEHIEMACPVCARKEDQG